jgi:hypothetical protein
MRRGKLTNKSILYVILAGVFTLLSFFLDQQVIQKEDTIRDQSLITEKKFQKIDDENSHFVAVENLKTRIFFSTHQVNSFSTINYKIYLLINNNYELADNFDRKAILTTAKANLYLQFLIARYNILELAIAADQMAFTKTNYDNQLIRDKITKLFIWDDNFFKKNEKEYFYQSLIDSVADGTEEVPDNDIFLRSLYVETSKINKKLFSYYETLDELSEYFFEQESLIEIDKDELILEQANTKIQKNYYILLSILFQILSLLSFLLLFKNFINNTFSR